MAQATGVNPKLNEYAILATLRNEQVPMRPNELRSLMSLVTLACYDRKVEREFFAEVIDLCALMGVDLADMESAGRMRTLYMEMHPAKQPLALDARIDALVHGFMAKRRRLASRFELVTACPTAEDSFS